MDNHCRHLLRMVAAAFFLMMLGACTALPPYHANNFTWKDSSECSKAFSDYDGLQGTEVAQLEEKNKIIKSSEECWGLSIEEHRQYTLFFSEFDEQGWIAGTADGKYESDTDRLEWLMRQLRNTFSKYNDHISLAVYVHGWNHTAQAQDADVHEFRELLEQVSEMEKSAANNGKTHEEKHVVGIYVGWRGESVVVPGAQLFSFWDRKNTAEKVAMGSVRELLLRLDALRDKRKEEIKNADAGIRMLTIGHSFGGLVLFEAIEGEYIRSAARQKEGLKSHAKLGDLVVVVNPAFEGTRYEPLYAAAEHWKTPKSTRPDLIIATSQADYATGIAFPVARFFSTFLESMSGEQYESNLMTVGHNNRYTTHDITVCRDDDENCRIKDMACNAKTQERPEYAQGKQMSFEDPFSSLFAHGKSEYYMCGGLRLKLRDKKTAGPVWVVETDRQIIRDHGDIYNKRFISFIAQIYSMIIHEEHLAKSRPVAKKPH